MDNELEDYAADHSSYDSEEQQYGQFYKLDSLSPLLTKAFYPILLMNLKGNTCFIIKFIYKIGIE